ncbi:hypothetical protein BV25DRAFT_706858 [Artomyces pyxidatus]|uniref:Uncharacterized protein n=1 Tax=Artomyces pyxidatus TaxID=48021 RepID=A0ACB8T0C3_9AGAM|nr:hypothetical protein BV25DRAFT_706858 [Artomyces pyxidatus]
MVLWSPIVRCCRIPHWYLRHSGSDGYVFTVRCSIISRAQPKPAQVDFASRWIRPRLCNSCQWPIVLLSPRVCVSSYLYLGACLPPLVPSCDASAPAVARPSWIDARCYFYLLG